MNHADHKITSLQSLIGLGIHIILDFDFILISIYLYNILGGRPFHPSVPSSIHPSSSSPKKKTMMGDFTVSEGHGYPLVLI
jgi:hypothetical protein